MLRSLRMAAIVLPAVLAIVENAGAQGTGAPLSPPPGVLVQPPLAQPRTLPAPRPMAPEGQNSGQKSGRDGEDGAESAPHQGGGCPYNGRKLDLIV